MTPPGHSSNMPLFVRGATGPVMMGVFWGMWLWLISVIVVSGILSLLATIFASLFGLALLGSA